MAGDAAQGLCLVADIGGTNARFALSDGPGRLRNVQSYRAGDHASFPAALAAYLDQCGRPRLDGALLAGAGPVDLDEIRLTNSPWRISSPELEAALGLRVRLYNDLEAVAHVLPYLTAGDHMEVAGSPAMPVASKTRGTCLAVNVGTGFGAAVCHRDARTDRVDVYPTEAGHITLAATAPDELNAFCQVGVSVEDVLSGAGLVRLYHTMDAALRKPGGNPTAGARIVSAADVLAGAANDPRATQTVTQFSRLFGRMAGDLVLAHAAWGGIFLCGSVATGWARLAGVGLGVAAFHKAFTAKGKMSARLEAVPIRLLIRPEPALHGLSYAASSATNLKP